MAMVTRARGALVRALCCVLLVGCGASDRPRERDNVRFKVAGVSFFAPASLTRRVEVEYSDVAIVIQEELGATDLGIARELAEVQRLLGEDPIVTRAQVAGRAGYAITSESSFTAVAMLDIFHSVRFKGPREALPRLGSEGDLLGAVRYAPAVPAQRVELLGDGRVTLTFGASIYSAGVDDARVDPDAVATVRHCESWHVEARNVGQRDLSIIKRSLRPSH